MIKTENLVLDVLKDENEDAVISILQDAGVKENYICYDLDYDGLKKKFKQLKLDSKIKIHYARAVFKDEQLIALINDSVAEDKVIMIELAILPDFAKESIIKEILDAATDELLNKKGFAEVKAYCFSDFTAYKDALVASGFVKEDKENTLTYRGNEVTCLHYTKK